MLDLHKLDALQQGFRNEMASSGRILLIFDEIQHVPQWDKLIRTLYEKERDIEIFLTGSNSELLSSELGSNLAGRFVEFHLLPFSFKEFVAYHKVSLQKTMAFHRNHLEIKKMFAQYLQFGGLPETLTITHNPTKYSYLQGILSKVVLDDIITRFHIRQPLIIEKLIHFLHLSIGNIISPTKIQHMLAEEGTHIKADTLASYIECVLRTFAMYEVPRFDWKLKRIFSTSKKYYSVDPGLIHLFDSTVANKSKQLENIVFLKLKQMFPHVYYGAMDAGREIDFIAKDLEGIYHRFQITQTLTSSNQKRELSAFVSADPYMARMQNTLLTLDEDESMIVYEGETISKKYLLKWLLDL